MANPLSAMRALRSRLRPPGRVLSAGPGAAGPDGGSPGWFERLLVPAAVVVFVTGEPLILLGRVLANPHRPISAVAAVLAAACSVPLSLFLLLPAAQGRRTRQAGWLIAAFVAINLPANIVIGAWWLGWLETVAFLAVVYLRPRWSVPAVLALGAIPATMAATGHDVAQAHFYAQSVVGITLLLGPLIWLARVAARLRAGRQELADSAVIAERVRIDDELRVSIGAGLERLIAAGEQAARTAIEDPAAAERELRQLTGASRRALARTRQMVSRYQAITVRSEITTAAALLAAAGVPASVDVPATVLDQELDDERLSEFRAGLTSALHDEAARACVITAAGADGDLRLEIRRGQRVPS
jgi:two-component system sensor histidine kinase DesK